MIEHAALSADAIFVGADDELRKALARAPKHAQIILKPASYEDDHQIGTEGVMLRSETPLAAKLKGTLTTTANGTMLYGVKSTGGITAGGFDGTIRRCDFFGWVGHAVTPVNGLGGLPKGGRLRVDYCSLHDPRPWFEPQDRGKSQPSRVGIRTRSKSLATFHYGATLEHLHFYNLPGKLGPGYWGQTDAFEPVPDGPSHPGIDCEWTVRWILVERCLGRDAVVDYKGGGILTEFLTLLDCPKGRFDFRMNDKNTARGIWLENCSGMAITGTEHELDGVQLVPGDDDPSLLIIAGSHESGDVRGAGSIFQRPRKVRIRNVNGKGSIVVGHDFTGSRLPVLGTRIEGCGDGIRVIRKLEDGTTVSEAPTAKGCVPRRMTKAECGVTAAWAGSDAPVLPDAPVEPDAPETWLIEWLEDDGTSYEPPLFWQRNRKGLADFTRLVDEAHAYTSQVDAEAAIASEDRPHVRWPDRLRAVAA